jgi:hypothetical protein
VSTSWKIVMLSLLVALSLGANAVLFARLRLTPVTRSSAKGLSQEERAASPFAVSSSPTGTAAATSSVPLWTQLQGDDLRELGRRLLAAGFPARAVISVLTQMHDRPWHERVAQARDTAPYWRSSAPGSPPASTAEMTAHFRERRRILDDVFGSTQAQILENDRYLESTYGFLPAEKVAQIVSIQQDYMELMTAESPKTAAELAAYEKRRKLLEEQRRADLVALLTPEELHEYDLRHSATSHYIKPKFMELTESEYRALFAIFHEPVTALYARPPSEDPASPRQTTVQLLESLAPQIRTILGEARYGEFVQATDPESERLNRVAARFDLPLSAAALVADARRSATARAEVIRRDSTMTPAQKAAALANLQADTTARITAAFGARPAEAYLSYDGAWLKQLTAAARP